MEKMKNSSENITFSDALLLFKFFLVGLIFSEVVFFSLSFGNKINIYLAEKWDCAIIILSTTISLISTFFYIEKRDAVSEFTILLKSKRHDLFGLFIAGAIISIKSNGILTEEYNKLASEITEKLALFIAATPLLILNTILLKWIFQHIGMSLTSPLEKTPDSIFVSDDAIIDSHNDLLDFDKKAFFFAESVINGGSKESLVFGIDAPWGAGKTSFINLCSQHWKNNTTVRTIIYRFEPLRYDENSNITQYFISDLVKTIQSHAYSPSLKNEFDSYFKQVKGNKKISFWGFDFEINTANEDETIEDTLNNLSEILDNLGFKIIVIIDDLDRLSWEGVKNILFAVKRSFMLKNMNYVLCYDTDKIAAANENVDAIQTIEFLEKFINIKISLFPSIESLKKYINENLNLALKINSSKMLLSDPEKIEKIKETVISLSDMLDSESNIFYKNMIGNIRKIKRIINTIIILDIDKMDHTDGDFYKIDLLHLLLIYINFPITFRDIYNEGKAENGGLFSAQRKYEDSQYIWINSINYKKYLDEKSNEEKFLLENIFTIDDQDPSEMDVAIKAKFNNKNSSRNLARYLNLIVDRKYAKVRDDTYTFIERQANIIVNGGKISTVFTQKEFSYKNGEMIHEKLWRAITNKAYYLRESHQVIEYLVDSLPNYSLISYEEKLTETRQNLIYDLIKILNEAGWGSNESDRRNNSSENIGRIAELIFGTGTGVYQSIINSISNIDRGILGIHDLLMFRLYCCANRNNSFFNVQNALSHHSDPNAPRQGLTNDIAKPQMRKISQVVFKIFKKRYIETNKNIFEEISQINVLGKFGSILKEEAAKEPLYRLIEAEKASTPVFILYQLANTLIQSGIGCGYYDEQGNEDKNGIAKEMNNYIFEICFNPKYESNIEYFINFLMSNFVHTFESADRKYIPSLEQLTTYLDKALLKNYWTKNRDKIISMNLSSRDKKVITRAYIATYKEHIKQIFDELDKLSPT